MPPLNELPAPTPLRWSPDRLERDLQSFWPGLRVEVVDTIGSTNTALLDRARRGDLRPCLLVAEQQNAGRGRLGRQWWSAPGASLTWSLGLVYDPMDWSGLSLAVGLALAQALDDVDRPPRVGLKWPNDLWMRDTDRKLAGILIETLPLNATAAAPAVVPSARWTVIGMGVNVLPAPQSSLSSSEAPFRTGYACTREGWPEADAPQVLHRIAPCVLEALRRYAGEGLAPLLPEYALRDVLSGRRVQAGETVGIALGPDATGALRVRLDDGSVVSVHSGEVSVRPC